MSEVVKGTNAALYINDVRVDGIHDETGAYVYTPGAQTLSGKFTGSITIMPRLLRIWHKLTRRQDRVDTATRAVMCRRIKALRRANDYARRNRSNR